MLSLISVKYAAIGNAPAPDQWDNGGLFEITVRLTLSVNKVHRQPDQVRI
jgi:hypothetical protein